MQRKSLGNIIEMIYSCLLLLVCGLYVLWNESETALGTPPSWVYTVVTIVLIPSPLLVLKACISFLRSIMDWWSRDA